MHTFSYFIMHVWPVVEKEKKNENPFTFWGEMKMTKILSLFLPSTFGCTQIEYHDFWNFVCLKCCFYTFLGTDSYIFFAQQQKIFEF